MDPITPAEPAVEPVVEPIEPVVETRNEFSVYDEVPVAQDKPIEPIEPIVPVVEVAKEVAPVEPVVAPVVEPAVEPVVQFTPEAMAKAVAEGVKAATPAPAPEPVPQMTQEEIDGVLKTAKYTEDDLRGMGWIPESATPEEAAKSVAIFEDMQVRAIHNAVAVANVQTQQAMQQMQAQFQPLQAQHQQQQAKQVEDAFYGTYPVLKEHDKIVTMASQQARQSGQLDGKTFQEAAAIVATNAAGLVKQYGGVELDLKATQQSAPVVAPVVQTPGRAVPTPAAVAGAGRSQTAKPPAGTSPTEFSIYDD